MTAHADTPASRLIASAPPALSADVAGCELARLRASAWLTRRLRWEYWPTWLIYAPLFPWFARLSLRHGGPSAFTAADPSIPLIGESKWDILSRLPADSIIPSALVPPAPLDDRLADLFRTMAGRAWQFPLILKPNVGERGAGVRLIRTADHARAYLADHTGPVLAQTFHPGPFEAGIFYVRDPGSPRGRIFSITDKHFPAVTGDGRSTLRALIWRHPRYRVQARVFLDRLGSGADRVPPVGERIGLAVAGNHCQGTMFTDAAHLITTDLTDSIDRIARSLDGFAFGRFDVRYDDTAEFRCGRAFRIVELNGVLSESTNIYDPSFGFWHAQRILRDQWRLAYAIGADSRRLGAPALGPAQALRQVRSHLRRPDLDPSAD